MGPQLGPPTGAGPGHSEGGARPALSLIGLARDMYISVCAVKGRADYLCQHQCNQLVFLAALIRNWLHS